MLCAGAFVVKTALGVIHKNIENLGNITVFDGGNGGTSNFLSSLVKTVAPSLGVLDKLPIGETVKGIINPESKTEEKPARKPEEKKEEKKK